MSSFAPTHFDVHRIFTVANVLSLLRLLVVPVWCIYLNRFAAEVGHSLGTPDTAWKESRNIALFLLTVMIFTDIIDGWIARRFNQVSPFGTFLDPTADKTMQLSALLCLTRPDLPLFIPLFYTLSLFYRDFAQVAGWVFLKFVLPAPKIVPNPLGRITTTAQVAVVYAVLLRIENSWFLGLVIIAWLLTVCSAVIYIRAGQIQYIHYERDQSQFFR